MEKCLLTHKKCPLDWSDPMAADVAHGNCPIDHYEREDKYTPTNKEGRRWINDFCHWLDR